MTRAQVIDLAEQTAKASPAVVGIMRFDNNSAVPAQLVGTGFVIYNGRHVITNAHVLRPADKKKTAKAAFFALVHQQGKAAVGVKARTQRLRLQLVDIAEAYDLALLTFQDKTVTRPALPIIGTPELAPAGRAVFSIGFPIGGVLGPFPAVSAGIISAVTPSLSPQLRASQLDAAFLRQPRFPLYQLDMTAYPGQSGSPLISALSGEVIGVVNATKVKDNKERAITDPSGISFAITAQELRTFLLRNGLTP